MAVPFAVTQTPPSEVGKGRLPAWSGFAKFEPKMLISDPGETGPVKLAALTTLDALNDGGRPCVPLTGTIVSPERLSRYAVFPLSTATPRRSNWVWPFTPISCATGFGGHSRV